VPNKSKFKNFAKNWLLWQHPLSNQKRGPDRSSKNKYPSFGEKIMKTGPVDPELIGLQEIVKKRTKERN